MSMRGGSAGGGGSIDFLYGRHSGGGGGSGGAGEGGPLATRSWHRELYPYSIPIPILSYPRRGSSKGLANRIESKGICQYIYMFHAPAATLPFWPRWCWRGAALVLSCLVRCSEWGFGFWGF